jgi:hypothetical protein
MALGAVLVLALAILDGEPYRGVVGSVLGIGGASLVAWGWSARRRRGEAIRRTLQRRTLRLAHMRGGRLTATEVASELDLSIAAAERILFSLDDGFRVRSDVTDEGLLVFEFTEIRARRAVPPVGGGRGIKEGDRA